VFNCIEVNLLACLSAKRILAFAALLLLVPTQLSGKLSKYHRAVPMGMDFVRGGDMCGGIGVRLESGDFFEGLRVEGRPEDGRHFRKKSQVVTFFPESLTVVIHVITSPCVGPADPHQSAGGVQPEFSFDESFIKSLRFEAYWKRDFEMRKADFEVISSGEPRANRQLRGQSTLQWEYDLQVTCPGVPLTDTLVIDVLSPSGGRVSRFSQKL
jgi:hypothetical protein